MRDFWYEVRPLASFLLGAGLVFLGIEVVLSGHGLGSLLIFGVGFWAGHSLA